MSLPLNIDWQQILLHLFNFTILSFGLYFLLYKPVKQFMDNRIEYYKSMDEEAKNNLQQSEATKQEYLDKLKSVDAEIEQKRQDAEKTVNDTTAKMMLSAKQEADKIVSDAQIKAEREREKLLEGAQNEITEMVTAATEKLILQSGTSESYEQFLNAVEGGGKHE